MSQLKKIFKLIFSAKYFESYFNLKLGHFYWDTLYDYVLLQLEHRKLCFVQL